jgi:energy-coupling factor transporter ATP-binding protein EcfA2
METLIASVTPSMAHAALLEARGLCKFYGAREVLHEVSFTIRAREIVTIVGPNGAGKTTLLNCLLGLDSADYGQVVRADDLRIGYVPQHFKPQASLPITVTSFLKLYAPVDMLLAECHGRLGQVDEQLAASQRVLSRDSGSLAGRITAAAALAAAGRPEKALAEYEAIAKEIGPEQLLRQPQVWQPLLRLRGVHQLRLPAHDRDWSQVTQLLDALERAEAVPAAQLATLQYDHLVIAGDSAAAAAVLAKAIDAHGDEPQLWERLIMATMRQEGLAAAMKQWEKMPAAIADNPQLLVLRARLATRAPEDEANGILQGLESKAAALPAEESGRLLAAVEPPAWRAGVGSVQ